MGESIIEVIPEYDLYESNEIINVSVYCYPNEPFKAYEFNIIFNNSLLNALSVDEGNIFNGFDTMFSNGTIDNENGTINTIYGLIIGSGNVTGNESLVNISFNTSHDYGVCNIDLLNAGITNETMYLSISVTNGSMVVAADWDINMDRLCNFQDLGAVGLVYGSDPFDGREDVNDDLVVNFQDLGAVGLDYGNSY